MQDALLGDPIANTKRILKRPKQQGEEKVLVKMI